MIPYWYPRSSNIPRQRITLAWQRSGLDQGTSPPLQKKKNICNRLPTECCQQVFQPSIFLRKTRKGKIASELLRAFNPPP